MIIQEFQYPKKLQDLMIMKKFEAIDGQENQSDNLSASQIVSDQLQLKHDSKAFFCQHRFLFSR
jgi:hypothetical protein